MKHHADIRWLNELLRNLSCYQQPGSRNRRSGGQVSSCSVGNKGVEGG